MSAQRLLERIERCEQQPASRGSDQGESLNSILSHLRRLLNTRQGNVPIAPDFGAPDFLTMLKSFPESIATMEGAIRSAIGKYEPRLTDVQVLFQPDGEDKLTLQFEIRAALAGAVTQRLSFESSIDIHGKVRINNASVQRS